MQDYEVKPDETRNLSAYVLEVTERKAQVAGVSTVEYMAGILEGRYERITAQELQAHGAHKMSRP